jgi:DNA-binding NtrC family response regulator
MAWLRSYGWPGNIRELRNVIERAVILCDGPRVELAHLPLDKHSAAIPATQRRVPLPMPMTASEVANTLPGDMHPIEDPTWVGRSPTDSGGPAGQRTLRDELEEVERARLIEALEVCNGNQRLAAAKLGMSRSTLLRRLDRWGLPRPRKE